VFFDDLAWRRIGALTTILYLSDLHHSYALWSEKSIIKRFKNYSFKFETKNITQNDFIQSYLKIVTE